MVLSCDREVEFAPVKNPSGVDSVDSARRMMTNLHRRWLTDAGAIVHGEPHIEISPLYALTPAELSTERLEGVIIDSDTYFE